MASNPSGLTVRDYIEIFNRRKWWLILTVIIGASLTTIYTYSLPALYRSSTLILVEPQQIPQNYVQATVTGTIEDRLRTLNQQITSRRNLEKIINEFNILDRQDTSSPLINITRKINNLYGIDIDKFLSDLSIELNKKNTSLDTIINRMRKNIEVQIIGKNNAFTVSYSSDDPHLVMNVTNVLASLFIEENLKIREQQAEGTTEFLANELIDAKRELEKQESVMKTFKEKHMGALPEQIDVNLRTLDRLQLELQSIDDTLKVAENRKMFYSTQMAEHQNHLVNVKSGTKPETNFVSITTRIEQLKEELIRLQAQFNENYPDIRSLQSRIHDLEAQLAQGSASLPSQEQISGSTPQWTYATLLPHIQSIKTHLQATHSEIESLQSRRARTIALVKDYERRVEGTFATQQMLLDLTRDYDMSRQNYQALLQKRLNARVSENLEKRQKAEQFRIIDPANLPQSPYKPDRPRLMLLGSLLSMGLGAGLILIREHLHPTYRKPEDLQAGLSLPLLGTIPRSPISRKRSLRLVAMEEPDSMHTEQYRLLYTRISQLKKGNNHTVFAISSAMKGEGKTVTSLNLATVMARDFGKKTLLIEGDVKNPAISRSMKTHSMGGLVDVLKQNIDLHSALVHTRENLTVLPAIKSAQNSSILLSSPRMRELIDSLRDMYDYILIDSPPILALSDMNIFAEVVDGIILIVRAEATPRDALVMAIDSLAPDKLVGIVLNDVKQSRSRYYHYYYGKG